MLLMRFPPEYEIVFFIVLISDGFVYNQF
jgi:hypothetical protein